MSGDDSDVKAKDRKIAELKEANAGNTMCIFMMGLCLFVAVIAIISKPSVCDCAPCTPCPEIIPCVHPPPLTTDEYARAIYDSMEVMFGMVAGIRSGWILATGILVIVFCSLWFIDRMATWVLFIIDRYANTKYVTPRYSRYTNSNE